MQDSRNHNTRIKFCGLTRAEDVDCAIQLGVDEIGLVFAGHKRNLDIDSAGKLAAMATGKVQITGLFMDHDVAAVQQILAQVALDRLQFHGRESADYCASFGRPWLKAIAAGDRQDLLQELEQWAPQQARQLLALLLDAHTSGTAGGSGEVFNWTRIPQQRPLPIYLAGGLTPANVAAAIRQVRPETVDVSSGIEISPGIKCPDTMESFVNEVRNVFESRQPDANISNNQR